MIPYSIKLAFRNRLTPDPNIQHHLDMLWEADQRSYEREQDAWKQIHQGRDQHAQMQDKWKRAVLMAFAVVVWLLAIFAFGIYARNHSL